MKTVSVLAYKNCQLLDVCGPMQVFASANKQLSEPAYQVQICALQPGVVTTNSGIQLVAEQQFSVDSRFDTLLIAGGSGVFEQCKNQQLITTVKQQHKHCRRLASICTGVFILAEAGLMDNRRAVTHWKHCQQLQQQYPKITVEADALFMAEQGIYTTAGVCAGIDLALALVADDYGHKIATQVARELVVFMHRPGGHSQFSQALSNQTDRADASGPIKELIDYIHGNPTHNLSIERLAEKTGFSSRHLTRLFRQQHGQTLGSYVEDYRLTLAQDLLVRSNQQQEQIAKHCGFNSADQLRRVMLRKRGITPSEYRQRFSEIPLTGNSP